MIAHHHTSHAASKTSAEEIVVVDSHASHSSHSEVCERISLSLFLSITSHSHLTVHTHSISKTHLLKMRASKRLIEKIIIIIEKIGKRILASEEIFEYFVSGPHVKVVEILALEACTSS